MYTASDTRDEDIGWEYLEVINLFVIYYILGAYTFYIFFYVA